MKATYINHMGTDLSVVNAARVSFGKTSKALDYEEHMNIPILSLADKGLIGFLARGCTTGDWENILNVVKHCHGVKDYGLSLEQDRYDIEEILRHVRKMPDHWTPFGHTAITLHMKAPIFVARQLGKHQVGMVWNEVSRRYVSDDPEFHFPSEWRGAADNVKQGSSDGPCGQDEWAQSKYLDLIEEAEATYKGMIAAGVCAEQARMVLPQSMETEWYWTGNLYSFANVFIQRTDSHAQSEVQDIAQQIGEIIQPFYPVSWEALTK